MVLHMVNSPNCFYEECDDDPAYRIGFRMRSTESNDEPIFGVSGFLVCQEHRVSVDVREIFPSSGPAWDSLCIAFIGAGIGTPNYETIELTLDRLN